MRKPSFVTLITAMIVFQAIFGADSALGSDSYDRLKVGNTVYFKVVVRSQNESSLVVSHSKGISQIPLSELSPEMQAKYGYDESSDLERERTLEAMRLSQIVDAQDRIERLRKSEEKRLSLRKSTVGASNAFPRFGTPPELRKEVDFRPEYRALGIGVRNQGRRPSCAIHAIVGTIELLEARRTGEAVDLSEYYLYWATLKTLGRFDQTEYWNRDGSGNDDAGFQIGEVLQAVGSYGIPKAEDIPPMERGLITGSIESPPEQVVEAARQRSKIGAYQVPGREREVLLGNIVHALNGGLPVVVGIGWPLFASIRNTAVLDQQETREHYGHAVVLVGYQCPTGKIEDLSLVFRNSWGTSWGASGYGYIRYEYIKKNLHDAHVVQLQ